jgi:glutaminyl-peptide cyclotransferase
VNRIRLLSIGLLLVAVGCDRPVPAQEYRLVAAYPHDDGAYTQGLVFHGGVLFESTGRHGESTVRRVELGSGEILASHSLPDEYFGEGLALVGSELYQLTWKAGLAFVYDAESLALKRTLEYEGDGWGLCYDGEWLYMSNGSDRLLRRDPGTFEVLEEVRVTESGFSVRQINELECVGDEIFANVFQTNRILRIDKKTGKVKAELDGYTLSLASRRPPNHEAVLNGIAYDPRTGHLYVTGKLWPDLFEIELGGG